MNALLALALLQTPPPETTYTVTLAIDGVTCDGCAETVRQHLARLRGARDVSAKLVDRAKKSGSAAVTFAETTPLDYDLLKKSLRGYNLKTIDVEVAGTVAFKSAEGALFTVDGSKQPLAVIRRPGAVEDKPFDDFRAAMGAAEKKVVIKGELVPFHNALAVHVASWKER